MQSKLHPAYQTVLYEPGEYLDLIADLPSQEELPSPLIVADPSEFQERINEFGLVEYW